MLTTCLTQSSHQSNSFHAQSRVSVQSAQDRVILQGATLRNTWACMALWVYSMQVCGGAYWHSGFRVYRIERSPSGNVQHSSRSTYLIYNYLFFINERAKGSHMTVALVEHALQKPFTLCHCLQEIPSFVQDTAGGVCTAAQVHRQQSSTCCWCAESGPSAGDMFEDCG